ncbi:hypothetical protein Tco_0349392 [Tanacetum coccineum]
MLELLWKSLLKGSEHFSYTKASHQSSMKDPKEESTPLLYSLWTWFSKVIIYYLARNNNIHRRPESFVHHTRDDFILGNLKFIPKGETVEVFGMAIPDPLITEAIQQSSYYPKYLEMVAENTKKTPQESASVQPTTRSTPPKKPTTTTPVKPSKPAPSPTKKPSKRKLPQKVRKGKPTFQLVDEDDEAQQESVPREEGDDSDLELAKKMSLEAHQEKGEGEGDDADMERAIKLSLDPAFLPQGQAPVGGVTIRDPVSETTPKLHEVMSSSTKPSSLSHLLHHKEATTITTSLRVTALIALQPKSGIDWSKRCAEFLNDTLTGCNREITSVLPGQEFCQNQNLKRVRRRYIRNQKGTRPFAGSYQGVGQHREEDTICRFWLSLQTSGRSSDIRDDGVDSSMPDPDPDLEHSEQSSDDFPYDKMMGYDSNMVDTDISSHSQGVGHTSGLYEREYDISAVYGITHWWFRRKEFYINNYSEPSDREAVRSRMRILSVNSVKVFENTDTIPLKRLFTPADTKSTRSRKDFKNLYPNDFEDLFYINIQEKLNPYPKTDKIYSSHGSQRCVLRNMDISKMEMEMEIRSTSDIKANLDSAGSLGGNTGNVGGTVNVQGCSHKTFMNGKPHSFNGTEGVVGLRRWIEKVEQVFEICKCTEEDKVMFAASTFEGRAFTWWNRNAHTLGLVNANHIP